jgi:cold shock CspA family protein
VPADDCPWRPLFDRSGVRSLAEGAKVSYDAEQGPKGPAAANIQTL